eukprot:2068399-Amphidinium_carterae.3
MGFALVWDSMLRCLTGQTDEAESKRASALLSLEENGTRGSVWSGTTDEAAAQRASVLLSLQGDEDEAAALRISVLHSSERDEHKEAVREEEHVDTDNLCRLPPLWPVT